MEGQRVGRARAEGLTDGREEELESIEGAKEITANRDCITVGPGEAARRDVGIEDGEDSKEDEFKGERIGIDASPELRNWSAKNDSGAAINDDLVRFDFVHIKLVKNFRKSNHGDSILPSLASSLGSNSLSAGPHSLIPLGFESKNPDAAGYTIAIMTPNCRKVTLNIILTYLDTLLLAIIFADTNFFVTASLQSSVNRRREFFSSHGLRFQIRRKHRR